jgi:serine/threonine protein kinase
MEFVEARTCATTASACRARCCLPRRSSHRHGRARRLEHAHSLGIVHYDIKPANILLTSKREVKLCDFGLSVLHRARRRAPHDNLVVGTPGYMCPEMIAKNKADHRADLYALAATLYDLSAGGPPFGQQSEQAFQGTCTSPCRTSSACLVRSWR